MKIPNVCLSLVFLVILVCILVPGRAMAQQGEPNPPCCFNNNGAEFEALTITSSVQSPELTQESGLLPGYFSGPWVEPEALPLFESMPADDPAQEPVSPHAVFMDPGWNRNNPHGPVTGALR